MARKLPKTAAKRAAAPAGRFDGQLAAAVKASAQQIWLAGMGAFAKAQAEGGKMFEALVKEGVGLQRQTQALAGERPGDAAGPPGGDAGAVALGVRGQAGASGGRLESIFEERTARALGKLGVPTADDVAHLARRVDELAAALAGLATPPPAGRGAPAARTAAGAKVAAKVAANAAPPAKPARAPRPRRAVAP